jgi:hypothetical protein
MNIDKTIKILEALASGCSPATGEIIPGDSVLNERDVIRALQIAIDNLKMASPVSDDAPDIEIDNEDIKTAIQLFVENEGVPQANRLADFFLATRAFRNQAFTVNKLYGKYKKLYKKDLLQDFFANYLSQNGYSSSQRIRSKKPWDDIDFFKKETFNNLSEIDINELKERINELGVTKTENLTDAEKTARIDYPRAYEPWKDTEKTLLSKALQHTNDIELLMQCFQRGEGAIKSCGKKLIYESQNDNMK